MRSPARLLLLAAAASGALALVLAAAGLCAAGGVAHGGGRPRPPPVSPVLRVDSLLVGAPRRLDYDSAGQLLGAAAAAHQDYGYVDPPPDTRRRGGTAPIPHN